MGSPWVNLKLFVFLTMFIVTCGIIYSFYALPLMISVSIKRLPHGQNLPLPTRATVHSAGIDLSAAIEAPYDLKSMERALIPTGFAYAFPSGYEGQIRPRSGLALKHGITVLNTPGTIDADYRGEVKVILINLGAEPFVIEPGMRIAQMIIAPVSPTLISEVSELPQSQRDAFGFGSSGY